MIVVPFLLTVLFHVPALFSDLVWDDVGLIQKHPLLSDPSFGGQIFFRDYGLEMTDRSPTGYYRPMLMTVIWLIHRLFGASPLAYHLFSLSLAGFSAVLLTWMLVRLEVTRRPWVAVAAGAVLAAHPMRTEFVSFFMSLPDLVIEVGGMLAIIAIVGPRKQGGALGCAVACAGVAAMAALFKETAFFVFLSMALASLLYAGVARCRRALAGAVGLGAGLVVAYAMRRWAGIVSTAPSNALGMMLGEGAGRAAYFGWLSVVRIVWPGRAVFMDWADHAPGGWAVTGVILLGLVAAMAFAWAIRRRDIFTALMSAWFGAGLLNVMLVTAMRIPYADRYAAVLPGLVGVGLLGGRIVRRVAGSGGWLRAVRWGMVLYIGVQGSFALASSAQCLSAVSFFVSMAEDNPGMAYPRVVLANIMLYDLGDFERCERYAREVMELSPDTQRGREMGKLLAKRFIAESRFQDALRNVLWAEAGLPDDAEVHSLKAICLYELGRRDEASASIDQALRLAPGNAAFQKQRSRIVEGGAGGVPAP